MAAGSEGTGDGDVVGGGAAGNGAASAGAASAGAASTGATSSGDAAGADEAGTWVFFSAAGCCAFGPAGLACSRGAFFGLAWLGSPESLFGSARLAELTTWSMG